MIRLSKSSQNALEARVRSQGGTVGPRAKIPDEDGLPKARGLRQVPKGMNKNEAAYAEHLDGRKCRGEIFGWWYEWITFVLAFDCRWTPDFVVMLRPSGILELHDAKGSKRKADGSWVPFIMEDAAVKLRVAGSHFPFVVKAVWWNKETGEWMEKEYR